MTIISSVPWLYIKPICLTSESDIGCSCHDFINPNGFGQCKKGSSYEHVKGRNVCYVNRPSNCSDLTYSSTNPGKKFSAAACDILNESKGILRIMTNNIERLHFMLECINLNKTDI